MNQEEISRIVAHQAKVKAFGETPLGKTFNAFDSAHAGAWIADSNENTGYAALTRAWDKERAARAALLKMLYELAGVGPYDA